MTGRDYDDPDDLPGLADVDPWPTASTTRDVSVGGQPIGRPITAEEAHRRLLAGERFVIADAHAADLLAGRLVEIPFPFQPKEPTMPDYPTADRPTAGEAHAAAIDEVRRLRDEVAAQPEDMRRRRAHVADGLNTLGVELDDLERLVNVLEERIAPILGPAEPMPAGPAEVDASPGALPGGPSELAELIFARNRHAGAIAARLERVIERIDV